MCEHRIRVTRAEIDRCNLHELTSGAYHDSYHPKLVWRNIGGSLLSIAYDILDVTWTCSMAQPRFQARGLVLQYVYRLSSYYTT